MEQPHCFSKSEDRKTGGGSIESLLVPAPVSHPAPLFFPACIYLLEAPAFLPACAIVAEPRSFPIYICCKGDSEKLGTFLLPPERNEFVASSSIYSIARHLRHLFFSPSVSLANKYTGAAEGGDVGNNAPFICVYVSFSHFPKPLSFLPLLGRALNIPKFLRPPRFFIFSISPPPSFSPASNSSHRCSAAVPNLKKKRDCVSIQDSHVFKVSP